MIHLPPLMAGFTHFCSLQNHFYVFFFFSLKTIVLLFQRIKALYKAESAVKAEQQFRKPRSFPCHHFFPGFEWNEVIELHVINEIGDLHNT